MICSKFITFAVTKTTSQAADILPTGCDLLKIHYLCGDKDNTKKNERWHFWLWFAQNSLPLRWQRQQALKVKHQFWCCDLLKIHYLCGDKDNKLLKSITAMLLWFAQNSLPLRWQRQLIVENPIIRQGCDLLKIHYLCGDKDNGEAGWYDSTELWFAQNSLPLRWQRQPILSIVPNKSVVICSKFITFAVTKTTHWVCWFKRSLLWFAQNSLPLRWQRQLCNRLDR